MNVLERYRLSRDRSVTVANLVDEMLRRNGDREISVSVSGSRSLSDVHAWVCALDHFLRETVGLRPGQLVAVYRTNNLRCFHWFLAIVRAGGIAVPLNPMLTGPEVRRILATSGAQIVVTDTAVFQHNLQNRDSPQVRTWIQDDLETEPLDGFVRAPGAGAKARVTFLQSSTHREPADFPRARHSPAGRCWEPALPSCWLGCCSAQRTWRWWPCHGRTSWR